METARVRIVYTVYTPLLLEKGRCSIRHDPQDYHICTKEVQATEPTLALKTHRGGLMKSKFGVISGPKNGLV